MSDRPRGSVRTGSEAGKGAAPAAASEEATPVAGTQSIPSTGAQPAVGSSAAERASATDAPRAPGAPTGKNEPVSQSASAANGVPPGAPAPVAAAPPADAGTKVKDLAGNDSGTRGVQAKDTRSKDGRGPRRARLQLRHIDTWSALKISLVLSIALFFIWMVAVGILYAVLNGLGVFDTLNDLFGQVGSVSGSTSTGDVITPGVVFGGAAVIGAINVVLMTALCTVATFIYNMSSDLVGGLEVTLSERD